MAVLSSVVDYISEIVTGLITFKLVTKSDFVGIFMRFMHVK